MSEEIKKPYYTIKVVDEVDHSEIDIDLYDEIFPELEDVDLDINNHYTALGEYENQGYPINIDKMISTLQALKEKGANYVALYYHEDHIGYPIEGLSIYRSTEEEIKAHEERINKERGKMKKIQSLQAKIRKVQNEE